MSRTDAAPAPAVPAAPLFASLDALRAEHQAMLEQQAGTETEPPRKVPTEAVSAFLDRARATGSILESAEDREVAQRVLDYWTADLVAASRATRLRAGPVRLLPWTAPVGPAADTPFQSPEDARQYIRLSALARQWRDSGERGYLLSGEALRGAARFERDPDVAALIAASRDAQQHADRRRQWLKNVLLAGMAVVILALVMSYQRETRSRRAAEAAQHIAEAAREDAEAARAAAWRDREEADAQRGIAETRAEAAEAALARSQRLVEDLSRTTDIAAERQARLDSQQEVLDDALDELARQVALGDLDPLALPSDALRSALASRTYAAAPVSLDGLAEPAPDAGAAGEDQVAAPEPPEMTFIGYDENFLGFEVPLPALTSRQARTAHDGGAPIPYFNFGIVLDPQRRLPVFAAANLDRLGTRSLPRITDLSLYRPDPRIPAEVQPDLRFAGAGVADVQLVERWDISWGDALPDDTTEAAILVAQMTRFSPNVIPQYLEMAQSWNTVAEWVRLRHNPGAARVTIFMGPVFAVPDAYGTEAADDTERMPVGLWKIAVSVPPGVSADPARAPLVVDAFIVPNDRSAERDAEDYRVTVDEIVVRTGLRFPAAIGNATRDGEVLAGRLANLGAQSEAERKRLVQDILALFRSATASAEDQRTVCAALLDMAHEESLAAMSPQGRVNLFFLLSQIPAGTWNRNNWLPLKGDARWTAAALDADLGPQARGHLDAFRANLGLDEPRPQTVYVQFAGLTREDGSALGERLRRLGWQVPGEERRPERVNQVRYNPSAAADIEAAQLLAADLQAAGFTEVEPAAFDVVKPGIIEVWVGR